MKFLDIGPYKSKFRAFYRDFCRAGGQFQVNMTSQLSQLLIDYLRFKNFLIGILDLVLILYENNVKF